MNLLPEYPRQFPTVWDSTMVSDARCLRRFFLRHVLGLKTRGTGIHLHAGGALAKAMEVTRLAFYGDKLSSDEAIQRGLLALWKTWGTEIDPEGYGTSKTIPRLTEAFIRYFDRWPLVSDPFQPMRLHSGSLAVEFNFSIPLPLKNPDSGEPLLFCGRFDLMAQTEEGSIFGIDEKTCSQLGASWSQQWDLRAQFKAYTWGARTYGYNLRDFIVRGVCLRKTDVDFAEAVISSSDRLIEEWYHTMLVVVSNAIAAYTHGSYTMDFGELCNSYGGCPFKRLCLLEDPEPFVAPYYEVERWNPLAVAVDG